MTPEERKAARKESFRRSSEKRWRIYRRMRDTLGEPDRAGMWSTHFRELREAYPDLYAACASAEGTLQVDGPLSEYKRWWLDHFTLHEIHVLARGLMQ